MITCYWRTVHTLDVHVDLRDPLRHVAPEQRMAPEGTVLLVDLHIFGAHFVHVLLGIDDAAVTRITTIRTPHRYRWRRARGSNIQLIHEFNG